VSRVVTLWLSTSTGWDLAVDVPEDDAAAAMAKLIAAGKPTTKPHPALRANPHGANEWKPQRAAESAPVGDALREALDMHHARHLVEALGATRQTQCVTILAFEAERAGLEQLPCVGPKALVEELLGTSVGSGERAMLANAVTPGRFVAWTPGKGGVRLDQSGRDYLAPALATNEEVVARR
jgi:hypothetical protein